MARRTTTYTVPQEEDNRDSGKTFLITEMSAAQTEAWSTQVIMLLASTGIDLPELDSKNLNSSANTAVLAEMGINAIARIPYDKAKPLLDEMISCVVFIPDPMKPTVTNPMLELVIEEVDTYVLLRNEFLKLHLGFFKRAFRSMFARIESRKAASKSAT